MLELEVEFPVWLVDVAELLVPVASGVVPLVVPAVFGLVWLLTPGFGVGVASGVVPGVVVAPGCVFASGVVDAPGAVVAPGVVVVLLSGVVEVLDCPETAGVPILFELPVDPASLLD